MGMARSVYSNEAGWGTSPMIHASAKTPHPVEQGLWGSCLLYTSHQDCAHGNADISVAFRQLVISGAVASADERCRGEMCIRDSM